MSELARTSEKDSGRGGGDLHRVRFQTWKTGFEKSLTKVRGTGFDLSESSVTSEGSGGKPPECTTNNSLQQQTCDPSSGSFATVQIKIEIESNTESPVTTSIAENTSVHHEQDLGNFRGSNPSSSPSVICRKHSSPSRAASSNERCNVLGVMIQEFDKAGTLEHIFKNLSKPILEESELDEIFFNLTDSVVNSVGNCKEGLTEAVRELFTSYVKLQRLKAITYNSLRKQMCPVVEDFFQKLYEAVESSFGHHWLDKSFGEIQKLYAVDDLDQIEMIKSLGHGMEFYYNHLKETRIQQVYEIVRQLKMYDTELRDWLENIICAENSELEDCLVKGWEKVKPQEERSGVLEAGFGEKVLEFIRKSVREKNEERVATESQISRRAVQFAVSKYCDIMEWKLEQPLEIQDLWQLHKTISDFMIHSFFLVQDFKYTFPWYQQRESVETLMEKELEEFIRKNQVNRKLQEAAEESAVEECVTSFRRRFLQVLSEDVETQDFESQVQDLAEGVLRDFQLHFPETTYKGAALKLKARINQCVNLKTEMSFRPFSVPEPEPAELVLQSTIRTEYCTVPLNSPDVPPVLQEVSEPLEENQAPATASANVADATESHNPISPSSASLEKNIVIPETSSPIIIAPTMAASSPTMAASSPTMAASSPTMAASSPTMAASSPTMAASSPTMSAASPTAITSSPAVISGAISASQPIKPAPRIAVSRPCANVIPRRTLPDIPVPSVQTDKIIPISPQLKKKTAPTTTSLTTHKTTKTSSEKPSNPGKDRVKASCSSKSKSPPREKRPASPKRSSVPKRSYTTSRSLSSSSSDRTTARRHSSVRRHSPEPERLSPLATGVGMFFTISSVYVSVTQAGGIVEIISTSPYIYLVRPPQGPPYLVDAETEGAKRINVYPMITNPKFRKTTDAYLYKGEIQNLWSEEIIALFLMQMSKEIQKKIHFDISSEVIAVALPTSVSSGCRHRLKTALSLSGFKRSLILQATTPIGLIHTQDPTFRDSDHYALIIYVQRYVLDMTLIQKTGNRFQTLAARGSAAFLGNSTDSILEGVESIRAALKSVTRSAGIRVEEILSCRCVVNHCSFNRTKSWVEDPHFQEAFEEILTIALPGSVTWLLGPAPDAILRGLAQISESRGRDGRYADSFTEAYAFDLTLFNIIGFESNKFRLVSHDSPTGIFSRRIKVSHLGPITNPSLLSAVYCDRDVEEFQLIADEQLIREAPKAEIQLMVNEEGIVKTYIDSGSTSYVIPYGIKWKSKEHHMSQYSLDWIEERVETIFYNNPKQHVSSRAPPAKVFRIT